MARQPIPIYTPTNLRGVAYALRYSWTAWPSLGSLPNLPQDRWQEIILAWESDGLRVLESRWENEFVQITFSATPQVTPIQLVARAKGRLQHVLRSSGTPTSFSRKLSLRALGANDCEQVKQYIRSQAEAEEFIDPKYTEFLESLAAEDLSVDLGQPSETGSGRYWYDLHLVLVAHERFRCEGPDHLHMALRGNIDHTPEEIALAFLNNLAYIMGQNAIWQFGYYAGTFGEYRMDAVRR